VALLRFIELCFTASDGGGQSVALNLGPTNIRRQSVLEGKGKIYSKTCVDENYK
jgi:hypothetical protein